MVLAWEARCCKKNTIYAVEDMRPGSWYLGQPSTTGQLTSLPTLLRIREFSWATYSSPGERKIVLKLFTVDPAAENPSCLLIRPNQRLS